MLVVFVVLFIYISAWITGYMTRVVMDQLYAEQVKIQQRKALLKDLYPEKHDKPKS